MTHHATSRVSNGRKALNWWAGEIQQVKQEVVLNRLCCDLREIVMADEIFDGAHMIDQLFGE